MEQLLGNGRILLLLLLLMVITVGKTSQIQSEEDSDSSVDYIRKTSILHNIPDFSVLLSYLSWTGSVNPPSSCTQYIGMSNCCSALNHNKDYGICQDNSDLNCPDGKVAMCSGISCPTGLLCEYVNCPISAKYCWGKTICNDDQDSCSPYAGLFCHSDRSPDSLKICYPVQEDLSVARVKPMVTSLGIESDHLGLKSTGLENSFSVKKSLNNYRLQSSVDIDVEYCLGFVALAGNVMDFTPTTTIDIGNIGVPEGKSISAGYVLTTGIAYFGGTEVTNCQTDAAAAYTVGMNAACDYTIVTALDGKTLTEGKYCSGLFSLEVKPAGSTTTGVLILDAENNAAAQWIFYAPASVDVGVDSTVTIINGGLPRNVWWILGTSLNTGVGCSFVGTAITKTSITYGAGSTNEGRGIALTSVTFGKGVTAIMPPIAPTSQPSRQPSTQPTSIPTTPSGQPSGQPSIQPSSEPSMQPR
jgi:hypothetical protein